MSEKPGIVTIYLQLMKLRVVILLQITAICAIIAHDLMVRSDSISGDRSWLDTLEACVVTLVGGTLAAGGVSADLDLLNNRVTNMGRPIAPTDAATRGFVDAQITALSIALS